MAINKLVINEEVKLDLTNDTVTPATLGKGATAHDKTGAQITGTMEAGVDTSDATATKNDIASGKTAYVKGKKVTGEVDDFRGSSFTYNAVVKSGSGAVFQFRGVTSENSLIGPNTQIVSNVPGTEFGTANVAEVLKGKTFTSEAGVLVTGMLEPLDTSDATAAAGDICKGKTAYVNGAKVTGTVVETKSGSTAIANNPQTGNDGTVARIANAIAVTGPNGNDKLIRSGAKVTVAAPAASFGDAAAADVKAGKTFTSQNGVKITGTDTTEFQETWVWNEILTQQSPTFSVAINFAFYGSPDNLVNCTGFQEVGGALYYNDPDNIVGTVYDVASKQFLGQELRKIIFFEPPTGDLLTYLQANAVKQDPTAAFQEIKGVTITENGTITIAPDEPYDGVKNVSVTVDVPTSSGVTWVSPES